MRTQMSTAAGGLTWDVLMDCLGYFRILTRVLRVERSW